MTAREFQTIYRRMYMPLCMYALRIVEDVDTANDVVQTSFMLVWDLLQQGHDVHAPEVYMYRAVRNRALAQLRTANRFSPLPEDADEVSEEDIETAERDARLWRAIDDMPPRRREIFLMSKRDGMTYAAIAEELGLSVKTVEHQISKALASLRTDPRLSAHLLVFF